MDRHTDNSTTIDPATGTAGKQKRRKSIVGTVVALIALAALGWLVWHLTHPAQAPGGARPGQAAGGRGAPATTVGVAAAERADIPVTLEALGTVAASATATVRPQVSGVLQKVLFAEGQTVKAGEVMAQIDPRPFEIALLQATGVLQRDQAQLDNARVTLQRYRTLLEQDSIARQEVDTQAALVKQLEGTVTTDRAAESTARLNLSYTRVTAPIGGRVGLRVVDSGNVVSTGDANGIAVITQVMPIDVEFAVPQDQVPELRARIGEGNALPVTALDRSRATVLDTGRFLALDNQVDVQTGTVRAKARFDNAKGALFPSQFVNVRVLMRTIQGATVVPVTALRHGSAGDFVYVLNTADRTAMQRAVQRGQGGVDKMEIVSGLKPGEQVITEGADRLKDGARVTLPGDRPAAAGAAGAGGRQQRAGNGARPQGTDGKAAEGKAAQGTDGKAAEGKTAQGTDAKATEDRAEGAGGKGADGKGTDGKGPGQRRRNAEAPAQ